MENDSSPLEVIASLTIRGFGVVTTMERSFSVYSAEGCSAGQESCFGQVCWQRELVVHDLSLPPSSV